MTEHRKLQEYYDRLGMTVSQPNKPQEGYAGLIVLYALVAITAIIFVCGG